MKLADLWPFVWRYQYELREHKATIVAQQRAGKP